MRAQHFHGAVDSAGQPLAFTVDNGRFSHFGAPPP